MEGIDLLYEQDVDGSKNRVYYKDIEDDLFYNFLVNDPVYSQEIVAANQDGVRIIVEQIVAIADALPVIGDGLLCADGEQEQREITEIGLSIFPEIDSKT